MVTLMTEQRYKPAHYKQGRPTRLNQIKKRHYIIGQAIYYLKKHGNLTSVQLSKLLGVKPRGINETLSTCPLIVFERQPHAWTYPKTGNRKDHVVKRNIMVYRYIGA